MARFAFNQRVLKGVLVTSALLVLAVFVASVSTGVAESLANMPWEMYDWSEVGDSDDGRTYYVAKSSVVPLQRNPAMRSYYRKVTFEKQELIEGRMVDSVVADMFLDCHSGRMDTLKLYWRFQGVPVDSLRIRKEASVRVRNNSLQETELHMVCGSQMPRYMREKGRARPKGSKPWLAKRALELEKEAKENSKENKLKWME